MAVGYRNASAVATGSTTLSIAMPTGTVQNDIMLMIVCVHDLASLGTLPDGWNRFGQTSSTNGTGFFAWKRAALNEAGPYSVTDLADSSAGVILSFSGCVLSGSPVHASNGQANASGTERTASITPTIATMLVGAACVMDNLSVTGWDSSSGDPATVTSRADGGSNTGSDTRVGAATGVQATAGAVYFNYAHTNFEDVGLICALTPAPENKTLTIASGIASAENFPALVVSAPQRRAQVSWVELQLPMPPAAQTLAPTAIGGVEAFGTATVDVAGPLILSNPQIASMGTAGALDSLSPDGVTWAQCDPLQFDQYGNMLVLINRYSDTVIEFAYSNNNGATWQVAALEQPYILRGAHVIVGATVHVLWSCQEPSDGILYRRYTLSYDGSNHITGITRDTAINLQLDYNASGYEFPSLLYLADAGALFASWTAWNGTNTELRTSMRVLSNDSADNTASNWKAPVTDDATTITVDAAVPYTHIAYGATSYYASSLLRKTSGSNADDLWIFWQEGTNAGELAARRLYWNASNADFSDGMTDPIKILDNVTRSGTNTGYSLKYQLISKLAEDTINDRIYVAFATYKDDTDKDTWSFAWLDATNDTPSSVVDVYTSGSLAGANKFITGDLSFDPAGDYLAVVWTNLPEKWIYGAVYRGATQLQEPFLIFDDRPFDIPTLSARARTDIDGTDRLFLLGRDFNDEAANASPTYTPPYQGYFGTLDWIFAAAAQTIQPSAVGSGEAFGSTTILPGEVTILPEAVASQEAIGQAEIQRGVVQLQPSSILPGESFDTPGATVVPGSRLLVGIGAVGSAESFGSPVVSAGAALVSPAAVLSLETFGSAVLQRGSVALSPDAIPSAETFGTGSVSPAAVVVLPVSILSLESFGLATLLPGAVALTMDGVASAEAFGLTSLLAGMLYVFPVAASSQEDVPAPAVLPGALVLLPGAIETSQAFELPVLIPGSSLLAVSAIASLETWPTPVLRTGVQVYSESVDSQETFGVPVLAAGTYTLLPASSTSQENWATPQILFGSRALLAVSIDSAETFALPAVNSGPAACQPTAIGSGEQWGSAVLSAGPRSIQVGLFASGETFGTPQVLSGEGNLQAESIDPQEAFGQPILTAGSITLLPTACASQEYWGDIAVAAGYIVLQPDPIAPLEAFPSPHVSAGTALLGPLSVASQEQWPTPVLLVAQTIHCPSLAHLESWESPVLVPGGFAVVPLAIESAENVGTPLLLSTAGFVQPVGIPSAEHWQAPHILAGSAYLAPSPIGGAEAFETPRIITLIGAFSIASEALFGAVNLLTGARTLQATSLSSSEAFGLAQLTARYTASPESIVSAEAWNAAVVVPGGVTLAVDAVASREAFGIAFLSTGGVLVQPLSLASGETFGLGVLYANLTQVDIALSVELLRAMAGDLEVVRSMADAPGIVTQMSDTLEV